MILTIIGGGPAGMMAAVSAAEMGAEVVLCEKNYKLGKKLYITGKGRCNLTNDITPQEFFKNVVSNPKFLYSAINRFSPKDTMSFFEKHGCSLKTERGGRVFPLSDYSTDVIKTFEKVLEKAGVNIKYGCKVTDIKHKSDDFLIICDNGYEFLSDCVIITCGGMSYPSTGSTGDGYSFARRFGHTIIEPRPALVAVLVQDDVSALQGLSLKNVSLTAELNNKVVSDFFGEMLFTDKGISGPIVLSTSSIINNLPLNKIKLFIDFKPALNKNKLDERILRDFAKYANKQYKNAIDDLLPKSLIPEVIKRSKIDENKKVNIITKTERLELVKTLKRFELTPVSLDGFSRAIVTAGGVSTKEIDPSTMESKLVKKLFFAGEIMDIDALTGGYNIQIAISSGYLAGTSTVKLYN